MSSHKTAKPRPVKGKKPEKPEANDRNVQKPSKLKLDAAMIFVGALGKILDFIDKMIDRFF